MGSYSGLTVRLLPRSLELELILNLRRSTTLDRESSGWFARSTECLRVGSFGDTGNVVCRREGEFGSPIPNGFGTSLDGDARSLEGDVRAGLRFVMEIETLDFNACDGNDGDDGEGKAVAIWLIDGEVAVVDEEVAMDGDEGETGF
jgi:hypothetical protein